MYSDLLTNQFKLELGKDALVLTNAISEQNSQFFACACKDAIGFDECNL